MAGNIWSCDAGTNKIYQHSGGTSTITTSFSSPGSDPTGLAWDGTNLWSCDYINDKIYRHSGGTSTITTSFSGPGSSPTGLAWETILSTPVVTTQACTNVKNTNATGNGNITDIGAGNATRRGFCYKAGTTGDPTTADSVAYDDGDYGTGAFTKQITGLTLTSSYRVRAYAVNSVGTGYGVTVQLSTTPIAGYDELWSIGSNGDKIYQHSGGTDTILDSFSTPGSAPEGLTIDGDDNLWSADSGTDVIYGHTGFTSSITTSFKPSVANIRGLTFDGTNLWSSNDASNRITQYTGTTSVVLTSFAAVATHSSGLAFDGTNLWECNYGTSIIYKHTGITSTVTSTFAAPGTLPKGLTWDHNDNLWSNSDTANKIYQHSGGTDTITTSFTSPDTVPTGLAWRYTEAGPSYPDAPTVTTQAVSAVTEVTATGNGNITATGGQNATRRGFCYKVGESGDPTTADSVAYDDGDFGTGAYTKGLTGLSAGTGYRVRAYAVNPGGTSYGVSVQLTTTSAASGFVPRIMWI